MVSDTLNPDTLDLFETRKAPDEILDMVIDWTAELALSNPADVINTSSWALADNHADDLTLGTAAITGNKTKVRISAGGRIGVIHYLVNTITTVGVQTHQRTIHVHMYRR
jgi:hypothetical protein